MENINRDYLQPGQTIELSCYADGSAPEAYQVLSVAGEGGSTVCYEATRERNGHVETGKLKEFYPIDAVQGDRFWYCSLERRSNGQLTPGMGTVRRFDGMCDEYIRTYHELERLMAGNSSSQVLKNYIQHGEVLYGPGVPGECRGTVYIWSPGAMGQGFDKYLADVRREPAVAADYKLYDILQTVYTLVDCIKAMHTVGLLHLDIKPSNFLVHYDSDLKINGNRISLFDINTLHLRGSDLPVLGGTPGYCAPEVLRGRADNRSDIYSVGAMLFSAIIVSDSVPAEGFRAADYDSIPRLVRDSKLIRSSGSNSNVRLMSCLAGILQKCLAQNPRRRFQSCEELMLELEKALVQLRMYTVNPMALGPNEQLAIVKKDVRGEAEPTIVIQKLLYQHPLYEGMEPGRSDIHALVVGSGTYGQKFIDITLQTAQINGVSLHISALSDNPAEDGNMYLQFRPELARFVSVNVAGKQISAPEEPYGVLEFSALVPGGDARVAQFRGNDPVTNREIVQAIAGRGRIDYVFIALGQDGLNRAVAELFRDAAPSCPVCYVSEAIVQADDDRRLCPVCVNEVVTAGHIDPTLDQMAFNTHCMWINAKNADMVAEMEKFKQDTYNYASSRAFALSVKYKLHSIGIELTSDVQQAAEQFENVLRRKDLDKVEDEKFRTLVLLEQRRWVLDRVTDGWRAPQLIKGRKPYEDFAARAMTKDNAAKIHLCIARSSLEMPLSSAEYVCDNHARWEKTPVDESLDELDRMSVELHQRFVEQTELLRRSRPLTGGDMETLRQLIAGSDPEVMRAYRQYWLCMKNILDGVESYARQHGRYRDAFAAAISRLEPDTRRRAEERLALVEKAFFPAIERCMHRDYKHNNCALVENIPYILTRRYRSSIAMAFDDGGRSRGSNEAVFANVASATALNPRDIIYLYHFHAGSSGEMLLRKLSGVLNYMNRRMMRCGVQLLLACDRSVAPRRRQALLDGLAELMRQTGSARLKDHELLDCADEEDASARLLAALKQRDAELYDGTTRLFESQFDNGAFVQSVIAGGTAYFEFDWKHKRFHACRGCRDLKLVRDPSALRIGDMFALMNAVDDRVDFPELEEHYRPLWDIYTGSDPDGPGFEAGVAAWNRLCADLRAYEAARAPLAQIPVRTSGEPVQRFARMLPEYAFRTMRQILTELIRYGAVGPDSDLTGRMTDACLLEVSATQSAWQALQPMLDRPHQLLSYYGAQVELSADGGYAVVRNNDTQVQGAALSAEGRDMALSLLRRLQASHAISALEEIGGKVSFIYNSAQFKRLLTDPGMILQIYTYYEALRSGRFDDVACGYAFRWEDGGVRSELACVMTRGYRSIMVECAAGGPPDQAGYHKLHSVAEQFGIGAHMAVLAPDGGQGAAQRSRGEQLNIVTISGPEELRDIGETLSLLIEE